MNLFEAIKNRRSVRQYLPTSIPQDKLDRIWEAVRWAPSACNIQPWHFLVIKNAETKNLLKNVFQGWVFSAPLLVVGLGNRNMAWRRDGESIHAVDVAIAMEHLALAATAEGLGTCWICAFNRKALQTALNIGIEWDPVVVTPLGYPDDPRPRAERKGIKEIIQEI